MEDEVIVVTGEGGAITSLRTVISMNEVFWKFSLFKHFWEV